MVNKCLLNIALMQGWIIFQVQELQHKRITNKLCGSHLLQLLFRLSDNSFFFSTGKKTFIVECGNLAIHLSGAPHAISCLIHIPQASRLILYTNQATIM